jgi:hypothetical protein
MHQNSVTSLSLRALESAWATLQRLSNNGRAYSMQTRMFLLLFVCYSYCHQDYTDDNSSSRLDLLHALVTERTLNIDRYHTNTSDKAFFRGHYYSDKAPGTVLLALPAFAVCSVFSRNSGASQDPLTDWGSGKWLCCSWVSTVFSVGLITAIGGACYFSLLRRWAGPRAALIGTFAIFLGAAPMAYATMLFSNGLAAGLLSVALWALPGTYTRSTTVEMKASPWRTCLAGLCCGLALASDFTAGVMSLGICILAATSWRSIAWFAVGSLLPVLCIPAYGMMCFGSPFTIGYSHQASFWQMRQGFFGILWPDRQTAMRLLFSLEKGLLFWTPFLLMAPSGYWELHRQNRRLFAVCLLFPVIHISVMSGLTWDWRAGWTLGPRYLAPILPFVGLAAAVGATTFPRLGILLALSSVFTTGFCTLIDARPPYGISNPLIEFHLPRLLRGEHTYNLGAIFGLRGNWTFAPLLLCGSLMIRGLWLRATEACSNDHGANPKQSNGDI